MGGDVAVMVVIFMKIGGLWSSKSFENQYLHIRSTYLMEQGLYPSSITVL